MKIVPKPARRISHDNDSVPVGLTICSKVQNLTGFVNYVLDFLSLCPLLCPLVSSFVLFCPLLSPFVLLCPPLSYLFLLRPLFLFLFLPVSKSVQVEPLVQMMVSAAVVLTHEENPAIGHDCLQKYLVGTQLQKGGTRVPCEGMCLQEVHVRTFLIRVRDNFVLRPVWMRWSALRASAHDA